MYATPLNRLAAALGFSMAVILPASALPSSAGQQCDTVQAGPDYPQASLPCGCAAKKCPYASVLVTVNADGSVARAVLRRSSGSASFDAWAIRAARESEYLPKLVNCKPVRGTYLKVITSSTECG